MCMDPVHRASTWNQYVHRANMYIKPVQHGASTWSQYMEPICTQSQYMELLHESQYLELVYVASTCSQYIIIVSDTTWCQYMQQVHVASTLLLPRTVLRHWIPEFSVDDDSAGAGEVGAEEEQKGQEADEALSKQVQLAIADPEQRGKDEVRGRPQASPNALGTDKSDPNNL